MDDFRSLVSRILEQFILSVDDLDGNQAEADAAHALYQMGYVPYTFFLSLRQQGPSAIFKQISHTIPLNN